MALPAERRPSISATCEPTKRRGEEGQLRQTSGSLITSSTIRSDSLGGRAVLSMQFMVPGAWDVSLGCPGRYDRLARVDKLAKSADLKSAARESLRVRLPSRVCRA